MTEIQDKDSEITNKSPQAKAGKEVCLGRDTECEFHDLKCGHSVKVKDDDMREFKCCKNCITWVPKLFVKPMVFVCRPCVEADQIKQSLPEIRSTYKAIRAELLGQNSEHQNLSDDFLKRMVVKHPTCIELRKRIEQDIGTEIAALLLKTGGIKVVNASQAQKSEDDLCGLLSKGLDLGMD